MGLLDMAKDVARRIAGRGVYMRPRMRLRHPAIVVPFDFPPAPAPTQRIAAVLHIFYPELAAEMRAACANIPGPVDVLVTTNSDAKAEAIRTAFAGWPGGMVRIEVTANRGRDMLSKFVAFADVLPGYDLVLFLHSKKSFHLDEGQHDWGSFLIAGTAGSAATVASILTLFAADARLGIVCPDHFVGIRADADWGYNRLLSGEVARRAGIDLAAADALDFPSGSMFWARPTALKPLLDLGLTAAEFPDEEGQIDGTLAHTLERLILFGAERAGCSWLKVVHADSAGEVPDPMRIASAQALPAVMQAAERPLISARRLRLRLPNF